MAARRRPSLLVHARYLAWAGPCVSRANRAAMLGKGPPLDRYTLHLALYRWAVDSGRVDEPDELDRPHSAYVAEVFARDPEAVKAEARRWWREYKRSRTGERP